MFDRRTPAQKAAAAAHQATVAQAAADEREAARVAGTPFGQAVEAKERGDRFFQMQIPISSLEGGSSFGEPSSRFRNHGPRGGLLGEIEDLGWHLEHTGFVFIETASVSTNNLVRTGQGTAQRGLLVGVYLFREVAASGDRPDPGESLAGAAELPQETVTAPTEMPTGQTPPAGHAQRPTEWPDGATPTGGRMPLANPVPAARGAD